MYIKKKIGIKEAKKVIENGGIVYTEEKDRGIGKSTAIKAYSQWTGKPVVVKNRHIAELHSGGSTIVVGNGSSMLGEKFEKGVLVDDIGEDDYIKLRGMIAPNVTIAGFVIAKNVKGVPY